VSHIVIGIEVLFGPEQSWPALDVTALIVVIILFLLLAALLIALKYFYWQRDKLRKAYQLFLFKTKQLGLTNYQFKVLNGIVEMISLKDPNRILSERELFERSIGRFLSYLKETRQDNETLVGICRDIVITHEKIYHPTTYRKPLETMKEIEPGTLIYFVTADRESFIAVLNAAGDADMDVTIFRKEGLPPGLLGKPVTVNLWRTGDADYSFSSGIISASGGSLSLKMPESFTRGKEVRHPYVDVMIPCSLETIGAAGSADEKPGDDEKLGGTVYKINENEAVVKLSRKIDYREDYVLSFVITDFNIRLTSKLMADKTISEQNAYFYTFKFIEATDIARKILNSYVVEHL
jgi:hypothetical protein